MPGVSRTGAVLCPVCGHVDRSLGNGPGGRPWASCRSCGSLERHRALAGLLPAFEARAARGIVLDVAPSPLMAGRLRDVADDAGTQYVGLDFDPVADGRDITVQASLTHIPLRDDSVGLCVCYHVLEHIPDDLAAMAELARVLAPGGAVLLQVPWRPGPTDEDPSASTTERLARFGQADHVRWYGDDLEERLEGSGLQVERHRTGDLYDGSLLRSLGLKPDEPLWFCTTDGKVDLAALRATAQVSAAASLAKGLADVLELTALEAGAAADHRAQVRDLRRRLRRTRGQRDRLRTELRRLRRRRAIRWSDAAAGMWIGLRSPRQQRRTSR